MAHSVLTPVAGSENINDSKQMIGAIVRLNIKRTDATMYSVSVSLQNVLPLM